MAKKLSKTGIVTNQLVLPHQVTQSIDALTGEQDYDINLSGSLAITGSTTMKLGGLTISDSVLGPGSLYVTNITASNLQVVNISSSFVTSSTVYTSGSNIFGDEPSDTHTFIGGVTASSTISASGDIYAPNIEFKGNSSINSFSNGTLTISHNNNQRVSYSSNDTSFTNREVIINSSAGKLTVDGTITSSGNIETDGYFSGSGAGLNNIPASGIIGIDVSQITGGTAKTASIGDSGFEVNTNITASGNISASGNITSSGQIFADGNLRGNNLILDNGGSGAAPAIRLSGDTNNGIYFPAPDNTAFVNAGSISMNVNTSALSIYQPTNITNTLTVGTSGTGHDVTFYGDTNGKFVQWDQSEDKLTIVGETVISGDTTVTGDSIFSGKFAVTSSAGELLEVMTTNAAASSAGIKIHSAATQTNRKVGLTFTASNDGGTTNEYSMGLERDVESFVIVQNNLQNLTTDNAIFEMGATGAITASGDISCSFQDSIITATTGSFNHIITDGETLEFRDATTRAKVGALKFDATNGLEVKDSTGAEGKMKTRELFVGGPITASNIQLPEQGKIYFDGNTQGDFIGAVSNQQLDIRQNGNQKLSFSNSFATTFYNSEVKIASSCTTFTVDAAQINFSNLPTTNPNVSGRLWLDAVRGYIAVSDG